MKAYVCKNCEFKFKEPLIEWRERPLNPGGLYAIDPQALYYPVQVCPKCGSDLIEPIVVQR